MSTSPRTFTVRILDKEYQVACPAEEETALLNAAKHLDSQMRSIRQAGKVIGLERIAVTAALNLAHELLQSSARNDSDSKVSDDQIKRLTDRLEDALQRVKQLEIG